jgi:DNA-directed RNA polymerase specialized sigma24 family protein
MTDPVSSLLTGLLGRCAAKVRMAGARHGLRDGDIDELMQETRVRLWKALGTAEKIEAVPASYV